MEESTKQFECYDISPLLSPETAIFPGDVSFQRKISLDFKKNDHLVLSSIETTLHIGAHVDAPSHYHPKGQSIDQRSLNYYFGSCQVITASVQRGEVIKPEHISKIPIVAKRVLFKTSSFPDPLKWNEDFNALTPELVVYLSKKDVILVGIDTPSIDLWNSKKLETHQAVYENNMAILEGIILKNVPDGLYTLVALPLKIKDADSSPVRAVLVKSWI